VGSGSRDDGERGHIYRSSQVILMAVFGHAVLTPLEQSRAG
jgi:hypothetical protein